MLYHRGRYFWVKFKWKGQLVRISTRANDRKTAERAEKTIRRTFALSYARAVRHKADPRLLNALYADLSPVMKAAKRKLKRSKPAKRSAVRAKRGDTKFLKELGIRTENVPLVCDPDEGGT